MILLKSFTYFAILIGVTVAQYSGSSGSGSGDDSGNASGSGSSIKNSPPNAGSVSVSSSGSVFDYRIQTFSEELYEKIVQEEDGNFVISPLSAQIALSLMYCGAAGQTAVIMNSVLDLVSSTQLEAAKQFQGLLQSLQDNADLQIANAIYVANDYSLKPAFKQVAANYFYSQLATLNFAESSSAANTINQWFSDETHGKITNLISPFSLNSNTHAVILNAIYFHGTWQHQFKTSDTYAQSFNTNCQKGQSTQVLMMHQAAVLPYSYNPYLDAHVIELPYENSNVSMILLVPSDCNGISHLQKTLVDFDLILLADVLEDSYVNITLPKFTIDTTLNLKTPLSAMGLSNIFSNNADFSGIIADKTPLKVTSGIQKAIIEVNESGTVAAAATGFGMAAADGLINHPVPIQINANHPFVFILKSSNDILFIGQKVQ